VDSRNKRSAFLFSLTLAILTVLVYAPVRTFEFVSFDDPLYVTENTEVLRGLTWPGVQWAATAGQAANWHPVTWLSHMLDVELFGVVAGSHHVTSLVIHVLNAVLLLTLLARLTGEVGKSAFVAVLFAIHPQHVESVAWVAERKDVMSTMFGFLAMHTYVSYVRGRNTLVYILMLVIYALALMSKPMLVTLPFVLLLLDVWPLRRLDWSRASKRDWWVCGRGKLPLLVMAMGLAVVTVTVQSRGGAVTSLGTVSLPVRLSNIPVSYAAYLLRTLWPVGLAPFYPMNPVPMFLVIAALVLIVSISVVVWRARREQPYLLVGWLWYLGTLVPVIGLIQAGDQANADRYTYVPLLGIFLMLTWGAWDLLAKWPARKTALIAVATIVVGLLSVGARAQVQHWRNSLTLWSYAAAVTEGNYLAHTNLGFALEAAGRPEEALASFSQAVQDRPVFAESRNALGVALMNRGRLNEADAQIREALRIKPEFAAAHNNLGMLLAQQGQAGEATVQFLEGLRLEPNNAVMRTNLGMALAAQRRFEEAITAYRKALESMPDSADAHNKLGNALYKLGKTAEGLTEFAKAVTLAPDLSDARNNLGVAYSNEKRYDEAIAQLREAIRLEPRFAEAHNNLGIALSGKKQVDEAIRSFETALRLEPNYEIAKANLEIAQAQRRSR